MSRNLRVNSKPRQTNELGRETGRKGGREGHLQDGKAVAGLRQEGVVVNEQIETRIPNLVAATNERSRGREGGRKGFCCCGCFDDGYLVVV